MLLFFLFPLPGVVATDVHIVSAAAVVFTAATAVVATATAVVAIAVSIAAVAVATTTTTAAAANFKWSPFSRQAAAERQADITLQQDEVDAFMRQGSLAAAIAEEQEEEDSEEKTSSTTTATRVQPADDDVLAKKAPGKNKCNFNFDPRTKNDDVYRFLLHRCESARPQGGHSREK